MHTKLLKSKIDESRFDFRSFLFHLVDRNALLNIVTFSLLSQSSTNLPLMNAGIEEEDIIFVGVKSQKN